MAYSKRKSDPKPVIKTQVVKVIPPVELPDGTQQECAKAFLTILRRHHPVFAELLPLQEGINKVIQELYPSISHAIVNTALYYHTTCLGYLENICNGYGRFNLDKQFVDDIPDDIRQDAKFNFRLRRRQLIYGQKKSEHSKTK